MSTYYYLLCHDCKVSCNAARVGGAGPGHLINSDVDVPAFMVAHVGHKVAIVSEHSEEGAGYRDFNSPEPTPPTPEEQAAQKERNEEAQRFQIFSMGCERREGFGPYYLPPALYDAIKAEYPGQEFPNFVRVERLPTEHHPLFQGVVYTGFGGVNIVTKPWSVGEPYPTETPWLMPDGRHVGAQRYPPPRIRTAIATAAILAHHIGENDHG